MSMPELPPVILEAICVYQTLLILGFRSEKVFCGVHVCQLRYAMYVSVNVNGEIRKVRALETPAGTGFRDLLGHWVFEDDSGAHVESSALTDDDRRTVIDAAKGEQT